MEPKEKSILSERLNKKLYYWFVTYNPLYFFSAVCVLFGMFIISRELGIMGWLQGQLLLSAVIQLYEVALIMGAALLFRTEGQRRPAVILGLMAAFFLFDCTFQTEIFTSLGPYRMAASGFWVLLLALKLRALAWALKLRVSPTAYLFPILGGIGLAGIPHALNLFDLTKDLTLLLGVWYGVALVLSFHYLGPKIECRVSLDAWGRTVLRRAAKAVPMMWTAFYVYHLAAWIYMFDVPPAVIQSAPLFLLGFILRREIWAWGCACVIVVLTAPLPLAMPPTAIILGTFMVLKALQIKRNRFWVGAVFFFYLAVWTVGWQGGGLPEPNLWVSITTILVLLGMAWRLKLLSAIPATVLVLLSSADLLLPRGPVQWGIFILVIGFTALGAGIAVNWKGLRPQYENGIVGK